MKIGIGRFNVFDITDCNSYTHRVTSVSFDFFLNIITITIEKGQEIETFNISFFEAQKIGFLNIEKLIKYCK